MTLFSLMSLRKAISNICKRPSGRLLNMELIVLEQVCLAFMSLHPINWLRRTKRCSVRSARVEFRAGGASLGAQIRTSSKKEKTKDRLHLVVNE